MEDSFIFHSNNSTNTDTDMENEPYFSTSSFLEEDMVKSDFQKIIENQDIALPLAAINVLLNVIKRSTALTMMGLVGDLEKAISILVKFEKETFAGRSQLSLESGTKLFRQYITKINVDTNDFDQLKEYVIARGEEFLKTSFGSRVRIAEMASHFIFDGTTILTHGKSRVVLAVLLEATRSKNFKVIVTDGSSDGSGNVFTFRLPLYIAFIYMYI